MSNNDKQFDKLTFTNFCLELGIKNYFSTPTHPQSNGQAEITIRTIIIALKTRLEASKDHWVDHLLSVFWGHMMTAQKATNETPFSLAFGTKFVAPVEIGLASPRAELSYPY